jgi:hypothetical protein
MTKSQSFDVQSISKPVLNVQNKKKAINQELSSSQNEPKKKKSKSVKEYVPEYRSGAYALLITLYKNETSQEVIVFKFGLYLIFSYQKSFLFKKGEDVKDYMLKNELLKEAQKYSDSSFKPVIDKIKIKNNNF